MANNWQCTKCGKQSWFSGIPPQQKCPKGDFHVWSRLGRFLKDMFR